MYSKMYLGLRVVCTPFPSKSSHARTTRTGLDPTREQAYIDIHAVTSPVLINSPHRSRIHAQLLSLSYPKMSWSHCGYKMLVSIIYQCGSALESRGGPSKHGHTELYYF